MRGWASLGSWACPAALQIPIGKLALYCACGGIAPHRVLPVTLDLGTDNLDLLNHPTYLGVQHRRLQGEEYFELLQEFMDAIQQRWPKALIQFEDFSSDKAATILDMYRNDYLCFNDDVQGTGAAVLAGILGTLRQRGLGPEALLDERIVMCGAGSAGMGILKQLLDAMEDHGVARHLAAQRLYLADYTGCVGKPSGDPLKDLIAAGKEAEDGLALPELISKVKPTMIIGCTGKGGLFTEDVIKRLCAGTDRPSVFALSNPTANSECTAEEAYVWSEGKVVFASGSPMAPVELNGKTFYPSQCNNMYIFPGVGLGASLAGSKMVSDRMFVKAAEAVAAVLTKEVRGAPAPAQPPKAPRLTCQAWLANPTQELAKGQVFPQLQRIRDVSTAVAIAVYQSAIDEELATIYPKERETIAENVRRRFYNPVYVPLARTES